MAGILPYLLVISFASLIGGILRTIQMVEKRESTRGQMWFVSINTFVFAVLLYVIALYAINR